jgi:hypothetical protein
LKLEAQLSPLPPIVLGGLLVVPIGVIKAISADLLNGPGRESISFTKPASSKANLSPTSPEGANIQSG